MAIAAAIPPLPPLNLDQFIAGAIAPLPALNLNQFIAGAIPPLPPPNLDQFIPAAIPPLPALNLDRFNDLYGAENDPSLYETVQTETRVSGPLITLLNNLQLGGLISPRLAILIKNNAHDQPFVRGCLNNLIFELRDRRVIGPHCFATLHAQLNQNSIQNALTLIYAVLLYQKLEEFHHRNANDPLFPFVSSEIYSEQIALRNFIQINQEVGKLEKEFQEQSLTQILTQFASKEGFDPESRRKVASLLGKFNSPFIFKQELLDLLYHPPIFLPYFETLCCQELANSIRPIATESVVKYLWEILALEEHLRQCKRSITLLKTSLETMTPDELNASVEKCKQAYNGSIYLISDFKNLPPCAPTRFDVITGQIKKEWIRANQIITKATGQLDHQFCSSLIQEVPAQYRLAPWPFHKNRLIDAFTPEQLAEIQAHAQADGITPASREENSQHNIAIIGCTWGGGHTEVTQSFASNLIGSGYHTETIDLPKVLVSEDPVRNALPTRLLNLNWTVSDLWNELARIKAFGIMNFLREGNKGTPHPDQYQRMLTLTLHELMRSSPSMVVTTYSAHNELIFDACEILGIPCLHIATDIDTTVETRTVPRVSDHIKMGIAFDDPGMMARIEQVTRPGQRIIMGPPVRRAFTLVRTQDDALRFKQTWGIDTNKKVVVISNGKNGDFSGFPEILARRYAHLDPSEIPIHLVVLCGKDNQKFLEHLERDVIPHTTLPMTVKLAVPGEKMEELLTMAAQGGCLMGKAGAGTLFGCMMRGTRILIDQIRPGMFSGGYIHFFVSLAEWVLKKFGVTDQLPWERVNTDFVTGHHIADVMTQEEEFLPKLDQLLQHDTPATLPFPILNCHTVFRQTIDSMLRASDADLNHVRIRHHLVRA